MPWDSQVKYDSRRRIKCHCRGWGSLSRLPCPLEKNIQKIFAMNTRPFTLAEFGQLVSASLEAESQGRRNPETPANVLSFCTPRPRRAGMPDKVNLFNLCWFIPSAPVFFLYSWESSSHGSTGFYGLPQPYRLVYAFLPHRFSSSCPAGHRKNQASGICPCKIAFQESSSSFLHKSSPSPNRHLRGCFSGRVLFFRSR